MTKANVVEIPMLLFELFSTTEACETFAYYVQEDTIRQDSSRQLRKSAQRKQNQADHAHNLNQSASHCQQRFMQPEATPLHVCC